MIVHIWHQQQQPQSSHIINTHQQTFLNKPGSFWLRFRWGWRFTFFFITAWFINNRFSSCATSCCTTTTRTWHFENINTISHCNNEWNHKYCSSSSLIVTNRTKITPLFSKVFNKSGVSFHLLFFLAFLCFPTFTTNFSGTSPHSSLFSFCLLFYSLYTTTS